MACNDTGCKSPTIPNKPFHGPLHGPINTIVHHGLAFTGFNVIAFVVIGLAFVCVGMTLTMLTRRHAQRT